MPGQGKVNFPITTASPEAQAFFNQGVAQLHSFFYFEAESSFRQVAQLDPAAFGSVVAAYWRQRPVTPPAPADEGITLPATAAAQPEESP